MSTPETYLRQDLTKTIQGGRGVDKSQIVYGMGLGEVVGADKTEDRVDAQGGVTRTTHANSRVSMLRWSGMKRFD